MGGDIEDIHESTRELASADKVVSVTNSISARYLEQSKSPTTIRVGVICQTRSLSNELDWLPHLLEQTVGESIEWCLYCDEPVPTELADQLAKTKIEFECLAYLKDADRHASIVSRELDLLVDTIGHGKACQYPLLARKAARVQASWCAFPMSSGLKRVELLWADSFSIPKEHEEFFTERILRFPRVSRCMLGIDELKKTASERSERNEDGGFRIGILGEAVHFNRTTIHLVSQLLNDRSDIEIVLVGQSFRDVVFQRDIREMMGHTRSESIQFLPACSKSEAFMAYSRMDVVLDSFAVSSVEQSLLALASGTPVFTLPTNKFATRGVGSLLMAIQRPQWIARDASDLVDKLLVFSDNLRDHRADRQNIREQLHASPICDFKSMGRDLVHMVHQSIS